MDKSRRITGQEIDKHKKVKANFNVELSNTKKEWIQQYEL